METYKYTNQLPELPSDPLLPKFAIPEISSEIMDSSIYNDIKTNLTPDPFLGVPVEFTDLSVYNKKPTVHDYTADDVEYMEKGTSSRSVQLHPELFNENILARRERQPEPIPKAHVSQYRRSEIITSENYDEEVEENLKRAFGNNRPEGKVYLIKEEVPLTKLTIQRSAYKPPVTNFLFQAHSGNTKFIKEIAPEGGAPIQGYEVDENANPYAYLIFHEEDNTVSFGYSLTELQLSMMVPRDRNTNELTARPVKFEE